MSDTDQGIVERINQAHKLWNAEYTFAADPIPNLYHYTTAEGLVGILKACSIYGSHIRYLNDASEVNHAIEVAKEFLKECSGGVALPEGTGLTCERVAEYGSFFFFNPDALWPEDAYVTCFCENGDSLPQWRAYATSGFAILFSALISKGDSLVWGPDKIWKTTIEKVIYSDEEKRKSLLKILAAGIRATEKVKGDTEMETRIATLTSMQLQIWAHVSKHRSFQHEQEWRVISYVGPHIKDNLSADSGFLTRVAFGQLVPCIQLKPRNQQHLPILGVRCGPNKNPQLTEKATRLLLGSHGYPADNVSTSKIPFRSQY